MDRVNAAIEWSGGKIYLFGGSEYVRLDPATGRADTGYPKPIAGNWPGLFDRDIDTGVLWNNGKAYFFRDDEYIRYDVASGKADAGYPRKIAGNWPGLFDRDIDAAILWNNGKAYFFRGDQYVRYDVATDKVDPGYPRRIADSWPGVFGTGIDDAARWSSGEAIFIKGGEYAMYDIAADRAKPIQALPAAWLGTASQPQPSQPTGPAPTPSSPDLSPRRTYVLDVLLPQVLPSSYGQQKFTKLTFGLTKDNPNVTPGYTTCGSLPMYIARMLKDNVLGGTNGLRTGGIKKNAWVVADGVKRPRPGDLYALLNKGENDKMNGGIAHVGVIIDAAGDQWKTADAGQGDGWAADYVTRQYDEATGMLSGEILNAGGARPPRVLAGWIDLDVYPFPLELV